MLPKLNQGLKSLVVACAWVTMMTIAFCIACAVGIRICIAILRVGG